MSLAGVLAAVDELHDLPALMADLGNQAIWQDIAPIHGADRAAARDRDAARMAIVDRALRFTARGHTTGEELMVQELAALSEESLLARLGDLPASRSLRAADATVVAAVLFQSRPSPLR